MPLWPRTSLSTHSAPADFPALNSSYLNCIHCYLLFCTLRELPLPPAQHQLNCLGTAAPHCARAGLTVGSEKQGPLSLTARLVGHPPFADPKHRAAMQLRGPSQAASAPGEQACMPRMWPTSPQRGEPMLRVHRSVMPTSRPRPRQTLCPAGIRNSEWEAASPVVQGRGGAPLEQHARPHHHGRPGAPQPDA